MKLLLLTWTLLILSSILSIHAHPSKPLNERSTELAWQAWLLVDEHQNKQDGDGPLRRRITPKSIFITPTFSPDKLQPCADGYESDNMGRCMKIIKIDEDAHLDFLLQKLNAQFGVSLVVDVDEKLPTPGPIKFEISLGNGSPDTTEQITEEPNGSGNVAIVVAPINSASTSKDSTTVQGSTSTGGFQEEGSTLSLDEGATSTATLSEPIITSTRFASETTLTEGQTTDITSSSTEYQEQENTEQQALFFRDPTLKPHPSTYDDVIVIGNRMREPESTTYLESDSTANTEAIRFDLSESMDNKPDNVQKFPFFRSTTFLPPYNHIYVTTPPPVSTTSNKIADRVKDFEALFSAYVNTRAGDLTTNERLIFNNNRTGVDTRQQPIHQHRVFNHRNRDKHHVAWQFPAPAEHYSRRGDGGLDVRYARGRGEQDQLARQQKRTSIDRYYTPGEESPAVYREVPRKDLSHIFGFKRAVNNR